MLNQISLFAANTKGALSKITGVLARSEVNIYTMLATDSAEFGIVRLIVDKSEEAKSAWKKPATSAAWTKSLPLTWLRINRAR